MNKFIFLGLLVSALLAPPVFAKDPDADPCGTIKEEIPKDWFQGSVWAPENPNDVHSKLIKIFYYGKIQKDKIPVVFFNGGPGQHSHDAFYILSRAQKIFDAERSLSFIFIDQRGTGCSDFYPQGSSDQVLKRLTHYGSRGIVSDAEIIRKKHFQDRPWIIFGQSYGAHIVHKYVTLYPKSIKAAFAHGNSLNSSPYDRMKFRIASQVRVMDEYLKIYPEDQKLFDTLADQLHSGICFPYGANKDKKACGWEITEDFVSSFLGSSINWYKLHQWINAVVDGENINIKALGNYVETYFEELSEKYSKKWASRVLAWSDRNTAPYDKRHCSYIHYDLFMEADIDLNFNAYTECSSILQDPDSSMDNWGRKMVSFLPQDILTIKDFSRTLKNNPQLQFYLYSGRLDPFVPMESFEEQLQLMQGIPNFHYKNFPSSGHEGYQTEGLIWKTMIKELN
jgi:pimeloyl-ACP methyl ester carboxylesterase